MESRPDAPTSYYDTFAKGSSPAKSSKSKGYAEQYARRNQPSNIPEFYSATPKKATSVLLRPKFATSMKNVENMDVQFEKDKDAFDKRAYSYRRMAGEKFHHHRAPDSIITLWEAGHIVDRGRGKAEEGTACDPIVHDFRVRPPTGSGKKARPESATRPRGEIHNQMGSYDPILHSFSQQRDPAYEAAREREFQRENGGAGVAIVADLVRASFDPILGQCRPPSPGPPARSQQRPASAPRASPVTACSVPGERPATPGRRCRQSQGPSWGSYDPILHNWAAPPSDSRFHDQNAALNQQAGINGAHYRKSEQPRNQGVYNPILNTWAVLPANPRIIPGLSFAPASMFNQPTPTTPKA